jgi:regulatory GntR family protein
MAALGRTIAEPTFKRTSMRDRIRDVLVARILNGSYPAGTQLRELILAREFNVSQAPIREPLRELEGSGVASERYRGTRVRGADLEELAESYELRPQPCCSTTPSTISRRPCDSIAAHRGAATACSSRCGTRCASTFAVVLRFAVSPRRVLHSSPLIELHRQLIDSIRMNVVSDRPCLRRVLRAV